MNMSRNIGFGLIGIVIIITAIFFGVSQQNKSANFSQSSDILETPEIVVKDTALPVTEVIEEVLSAPTVTTSLLLDEPAVTVVPVSDSRRREIITLAGGCFWCSEAYLQETPGVVDVVSGYAGGSASDANYKAVSSGKTAHREAVQVTFDPGRITVDEVLDVYWAHIDPTDSGGQFADRGFHYTTAIYYHSPEQKNIAEASKDRLSNSGLFSSPIVTIITPYTTFFKAEEYHQDYYKKSSEYYERYKKASGRAGFVEENWAKAAALEFIESNNQ